MARCRSGARKAKPGAGAGRARAAPRSPQEAQRHRSAAWRAPAHRADEGGIGGARPAPRRRGPRCVRRAAACAPAPPDAGGGRESCRPLRSRRWRGAPGCRPAAQSGSSRCRLLACTSTRRRAIFTTISSRCHGPWAGSCPAEGFVRSTDRLGDPAANGLAAHRDAALQYQLLDIAHAEGEAEIQPHNSVADRVGREAMTVERERSYPCPRVREPSWAENQRRFGDSLPAPVTKCASFLLLPQIQQ